MALLRAEKLAALPVASSIRPSTLYFIAPPGSDEFELFVSNSSGDAVLSQKTSGGGAASPVAIAQLVNTQQIDLNATTNWVDIPMSSNDIDSSAFQLSNNGLKCLFGGRVRVSANAYLDAGNGSIRPNPGIRITGGGSHAGLISASSYIRNGSGHDTSSVHLASHIISVSNGDVIKLQCRREGAGGIVNNPVGGTLLTLEKIS